MKVCKNCGENFPSWCKIDGKKRNLQRRKYCFKCSPYKSHNTKKLHSTKNTKHDKICTCCKLTKKYSDFYTSSKKTQSRCKQCVSKYQCDRWIDLKLKAINLFGGKCQKCGYNKNYAALEFHHLDPKEKDYSWNKLRLRSWAKIISELKKCILLCSNCHKETHNPQANLNNLDIQTNLNIQLNSGLQSTGNCPVCDKEVYGTKFCSCECAGFSRRRCQRPSKSELEKLINEMTWTDIGKKYGVSDNAVRKWAKQYGIK